ncbi:probable papain cysteine protease, partial [Thalassiosira pseudonana CCMP1335]
PVQHIIHPLPHHYLTAEDLPQNFTWQNVNAHSYLTRMRNQHIPQYCGSCWAHSALSSLADRVKIMRSYTGPDIDLSVQYLLNCGIANETETHPHKLSCHGGNSLYAYDYIHSTLGFIPEDSCLNYIACSSESDEGWCPEVRSLTTCAAWNVCRTCDNIEPHNIHAIQSEIYARGPIKAAINANPLRNYTGGILGSDDDPAMLDTHHNHGVSIVGWGYDEERKTQHWIVRNSWGVYWGEMGFFRI